MEVGVLDGDAGAAGGGDVDGDGAGRRRIPNIRPLEADTPTRNVRIQPLHRALCARLM